MTPAGPRITGHGPRPKGHGPRTCEHCRWWRAMIVGYGKVRSVCWCATSYAHYMMETGAAATCDRWERSWCDKDTED